MNADNLQLWNAVKETDPKYTKSFSRSGGFSGTAINATYLIRKATEQWGPIGGTWGYEVVDEKYVPGAQRTETQQDVIHVLRIKFYHPAGQFEAFGQTTFVGYNKHGAFTDEEAPKKSLTDALTKALSMLGFASDVHLGLYDDNKYVNDLKAKFSEKPQSAKSITQSAWDELPAEEQKWLQDIADGVRVELNERGPEAALAILEEQGLDADHKAALWSRFDSRERSAMKSKKAA